jgi:hypothetical protein
MLFFNKIFSYRSLLYALSKWPTARNFFKIHLRIKDEYMDGEFKHLIWIHLDLATMCAQMMLKRLFPTNNKSNFLLKMKDFVENFVS